MLAASDCRAVDDEYGGVAEWDTIVGLPYLNADVLGVEDWFTDWWPSPGVLLETGGLADVRDHAQFQRYWPNSGCNGRLAFSGVTRDQYGSPVGNCMVRCYRTSTGELQSQVLSDPSTGAYIATTPYLEAHFLTVHKAGTPNIAGASIDTVQPA